MQSSDRRAHPVIPREAIPRDDRRGRPCNHAAYSSTGEYQMKITDVRFDRLRPRGALLRIFTDEGIVGYSEASAMPGIRGFIEEGLKPIVVGKDPRRIGRLWDEMFYGT